MNALEWTRPAGFAALALPVLLVLVSRLRARPLARPTGTLALWQRVASEPARAGRRSRPRVSLATWCAVVALVCGALALAGPRVPAGALRRTFRVVVDRSPGMFLPHGAEPGTRLDVALARARAWLASELAPADRVTWTTPGHAEHATDRAGAPPDAWLAAPRWHAPRPRFAAHDVAGALWITDRAPAALPQRAGFVASGGSSAPGAVGVVDGRLALWSGAPSASALDVGSPAPERALSVDAAVPAPIAELARLWADESGWRVAAGAASADLALGAQVGAELVELAAGRDGWSARGPAVASGARFEPDARPSDVWLRAAGGTALVASRPGEVRVGWRALDEPEGDPAAFAVSWAALFERAALPPAGVVPFEHRLAAGEPRRHLGAPPPARAGAGARDAPLALDAWLAGAAALALVLAAALAARER